MLQRLRRAACARTLRPISRVRAARPVPRCQRPCARAARASRRGSDGRRRWRSAARCVTHGPGSPRPAARSPRHAFRGAAADPGVHFVEDQRARASRPPARRRQARLERQREARNFAAGGHLSIGFGSSPTFGDTRNRTVVGALVDRARRRSPRGKTVRSMASDASSSSTRFSNFRAAPCGARSVRRQLLVLAAQSRPERAQLIHALPACSIASIRPAPPPETPPPLRSSAVLALQRSSPASRVSISSSRRDSPPAPR